MFAKAKRNFPKLLTRVMSYLVREPEKDGLQLQAHKTTDTNHEFLKTQKFQVKIILGLKIDFWIKKNLMKSFGRKNFKVN